LISARGNEALPINIAFERVAPADAAVLFSREIPIARGGGYAGSQRIDYGVSIIRCTDPSSL
jgi:hypothetical protein